MATSIRQQLIAWTNLQGLGVDKIHFGLTDQLDIPNGDLYATIDMWDDEFEYHTGGLAFANSKFRLHTFANSAEVAENLALAIDDQWNLSSPTGEGSRLLKKKSSPVQEKLYVFHYLIEYELFTPLG